MNRQAASMSDGLANLGIGLLIATAGIAAILRVAGTIAAILTGTPQPHAGITAGITVLLNPADPAAALEADGLNTIAYWITTTLLLVVLSSGVWWVWTKMRHHSQSVQTDPRRLQGIATSGEVSRVASDTALIKRAGTLRPSLDAPKPSDVGYLLGSSHGKRVWASVEDSILLVGPPRSGKGLHVVINAILDAPGAVVTTSTRPDNLTATLRARQRMGPVAVFDPQHLAEGLPAGLRWSPVRGCEDPLTAMIRATGRIVPLDARSHRCGRSRRNPHRLHRGRHRVGRIARSDDRGRRTHPRLHLARRLPRACRAC